MDLSNLNPFKKKDNEFNLNESSLPSLSSNDNSDSFNSSSNDSLPPIPNSDNSSNDFSQSSDLNTSSLSSDNSFNTSQQNDFSNTNDNSEFKPKAFSSEAMTSPPDLTPQSDGGSDNFNSSHAQQLSNAQSETTLAKVSLMEARLNSIESKLDMISQILLEEVSDETKKKLKLKSMMDRIK